MFGTTLNSFGLVEEIETVKQKNSNFIYWLRVYFKNRDTNNLLLQYTKEAKLEFAKPLPNKTIKQIRSHHMST